MSPAKRVSLRRRHHRERKTRGVAAAAPPTLQVGPSCEVAGQSAVVLGRNKEACLADEKAAQGTLKQNWSKFSAAVKSQCVGLEITGGAASYVELLSCMEVMRDAKSIEATDPLAGDTEPAGTRRGGDNGRSVRARRRHPT
jgi:hypothetical protein